MINGVRPDYMLTRCKIMLGKSMLQTRRRSMLRGPVDVSIDMHDVPLYAKIMRLVYAIKSRSKHGTDTLNRMATLHCVTNNQRTTLAVEVVRREDETADIVGRMLDWCGRHGIDISSLTMDRVFYAVVVINAVKKRGAPMIMPAVKNSRTLDKIKQYDSGEIGAITEHTISSGNDSAVFNLIIIKRKKKISQPQATPNQRHWMICTRMIKTAIKIRSEKNIMFLPPQCTGSGCARVATRTP